MYTASSFVSYNDCLAYGHVSHTGHLAYRKNERPVCKVPLYLIFVAYRGLLKATNGRARGSPKSKHLSSNENVIQ